VHWTYRVLAPAFVAIFVAGFATPAQALPVSNPDNTGMVDLVGAGTGADAVAVRTLAQSGSNLWVGGKFTEIDDANGNKVRDVDNLAVFNSVSGSLQVGVHIPSVTKTGGVAEIYDSSVGPDGDLYLAGDFDHVDGQARVGVAAIDAITGELVAAFHPNAGNAKSVLASVSAIFVGNTRLRSFQPNGMPTPGFSPPLAIIDPGIRAHSTQPQFRDLALEGGTLVAACACDALTDSNGTRNVKAVVEIDAANGNWVHWSPEGLDPASGPFGIGLIVHPFPSTGAPTIYLAAGGSDFTAAYDFVTGKQRFKEDTSGSSQAITWYQGDLIVGGHFDWSQKAGNTGSCGDNASPNPPACWHTPKLTSFNATTGAPVLDASGRPWNPGICCLYNGVWALLVGNDGSTLHVGGEFTKAGGTWSGSDTSWSLTGATKQKFYARFGGLISANDGLTIQKTSTGGATGTVTSSPAGISCGASCSSASFAFPPGTVVTLTAVPTSGDRFLRWSSSDPGFSCPGTGPCKVAMNMARTVTAEFGLTAFQLSVAKGGHTADTSIVTSRPEGIDCGSTCSALFPPNTEVTLVATPGPDSVFKGWSGAGCSGTGSCVVTMVSVKTVKANFDKVHR
jgi:Divergent InlB B-repeat domain